MSRKRNKKQQVVEVKAEETQQSKEGIMMKIGSWSLKKKILVGMGAIGAAALGAIAYGRYVKDEEVEYNGSEDDDEDEDEDDEYGVDDDELAELERMEQEELADKSK